jgi:2'-5' RNA ligase
MRLFVAVELPAPIRDAVERHVRSLPAIPNVRWSRTATHVTLRFLGDTAPGQVPDLTAALSTVRHPPFTATLGSAGQFPEHGRARVLWWGFTDPASFASLARAVDAALELPEDPRPFHPHVTIGRCHRPVRFPRELAEVPVLGSFNVEEFSLFESTLGSTAIHTPLAHFTLANVTQSSP